MSKQTVIKGLWERFVETEFVPEHFAKQILWHGGIDMVQLTEEDLVRLFEGRFTGDWAKVAFSFSELLAVYSVPDKDRGQPRLNEEIVGWVFASFVMAEVIKQGNAEWEMEFNLFMNGFLAVRDELEIDEIVEIFQQVFAR